MSVNVFVDTNILVYAHDVASGNKHVRARALVEELWANGGAFLSTQVLQELCVSLQRKVANPWPVDDIRALIEDYSGWRVVVNTPASVMEALTISSRFQLSFWDALILHAATASGASILYSEDFSDGQHFGPISVRNPVTA